MEFRNAVFNRDGSIECEVHEPKLGWIPFTAYPDDDEGQSKVVFEAAKAVAKPAPPRNLEAVKRDKLREINDAYSREVVTITRDYPEAEQMTWDRQEREAREWMADNAADTPYIDALAASRGLDKQELVTRILAKSDAWIAASASYTGKRQRLEKQVEKAQRIEDVDVIAW